MNSPMKKTSFSLISTGSSAPKNDSAHSCVARSLGGTVRQKVAMQSGIPIDKAREIVKLIKNSKLKVQAAIQGDQVRVTSASKDDLQDAIRALREHDFGVSLQFGNYR